MNTPTLRGLAKAHSDGLIDRKRYIRERRHLIDDIVAGNIEIVAYNAPQAAADPAVERTFSDGEATLEIPRLDSEAATIPVVPAKKSGRSGLVIAIVVIGTAAAYMGYLAMNRVEPAATAATAIAETSISETSNPAAALLESFLDDNTWLPKRIEGFMLAWDQEPQSARDALNDTPTMRRAADLITQQILEEKALFELGEQDTALRKQRRLLDLANALSIQNERISRQETEWLGRQNARLAAQETGNAQGNAESAIASTAGHAIVPMTADSAATATSTSADPPSSPAADQAANSPPLIDNPEDATSATAIATSPAVASTVVESPVIETPAAATTPVVDTPVVEPPTVVTPDVVTPVAESAADAASKTKPAAVATRTAPVPRDGANSAQAAASKSSAKRKGCRAALAKQRRPYCRDTLGKNLSGPTLVVLPAGKAEIGGIKPTEKPKYTVDIKRPFGLGVFEVSNAEFNTFCQATKQNCPAQPWSDPNFPVVNVSWTLATKYTQWLSEKSGATYRLPTESEWEYAARAGTRSPYPFGDEVLPTHARFSFRGPESAPVAASDRTVNRNKFRLYHMIGNVREWVLDAWHENHSGAAADGSARVGATTARVARGGSYGDGADQVRSASRVRIDGDRGDAQTGFRVLREVE